MRLQRLGLGKEGVWGGGGGEELLEFFNVSGEVLVGTKMPGGSGVGEGQTLCCPVSIRRTGFRWAGV